MIDIPNPILPGFYPDPSVCAVGGDYYLVTSTFAYFPGVPVFHSKDLRHWTQIGNVLDRPSQLPLGNDETSRGIFAPTIRYHDSTFYMITTNISHGGNFLVTAQKPEGPWSEPHYLDVAGIDPSLFFDDDGKCWCMGARDRREGAAYNGDNEIWLQELDLRTMKLVGESYALWHGALKNAIWPEAPHLYKKDGWYYLMIAEGGTCFHHSVTVARSRTLTGPFTGNPANPILTHRHLGRPYPVVNVGHGDLLETPDGEWYMVLLGSRIYGGYYRNLGRETFLARVTWEDDWPVVNAGSGVIETTPGEPVSERDDFDADTLGLSWMRLRNPRESDFSLTERKGWLRLRLSEGLISELDEHISFVCTRQRHICFAAETEMEFTPSTDGQRAGLVVYQNHKYHYQFLRVRDKDGDAVVLWKCENGEITELARHNTSAGRLKLKVEAHEQDYSFYYAEQSEYKSLYENANGRILSTDVAGGFVGTTLGMYAGGDDIQSNNIADFNYFSYMSL